MTPNDRVRVIRDRIGDERAQLLALGARVRDPEVRDHLLKPATASLDDVELFFLERSALQEPRGPQAWARWLDQAEAVVARAAEARRWAEQIINKYGSAVRLVAG
jgi:hypothetical protein